MRDIKLYEAKKATWSKSFFYTSTSMKHVFLTSIGSSEIELSA
jgi:hypothetical protein